MCYKYKHIFENTYILLTIYGLFALIDEIIGSLDTVSARC